MPFQFQDRAPDQEGEQGNPRGGRGQRGQWRPAVARRQNCRAVGPEAEEAGVAEADLPGVADQQVESDAYDRVDADEDRDLVPVIVDKRERQDQDHRGKQRDAPGARRSPRHRYTRSALFLPNRPLGMKNSTARMMTNAIASLYAELM